MKKSIIVITVCLIIILSLSSCNEKMKVNKEFTGEGVYFSVSYVIKGTVTTKLNDKNISEYVVSNASSDLLLEYMGDEKDLEGIMSYKLEGPRGFVLTGTRDSQDRPFSLESLLHYMIIPNSIDLLYYYYDNENPSITIEWDGEISGKETIKLN